MAFVPYLTPGREDKRGAMQVPHDIFVHVTTVDGWIDHIESYQPSSRRVFLESIKYWMDLNGACIIRSASSSRYAEIKNISWCSTIAYSNPQLNNDNLKYSLIINQLAVVV